MEDPFRSSNSREKKIPKKISHFFWKFFRELSFFEHENLGRLVEKKHFCPNYYENVCKSFIFNKVF